MPYKDPVQQKQAQAAWYQNNKGITRRRARIRNDAHRAALRELVCGLKSAPCADCNSSFPPKAMDFDHVRGNKIANVSILVKDSARATAVLDEIAKCDLVCANCHRMRTFNRRPAGPPHPNPVVADAVNKLKNNPCVDCGGSFHTQVMDFDHVSGEKTANVSGLVRRLRATLAVVLAEIAKCELVCANCHRVRTFNRRATLASAGD